MKSLNWWRVEYNNGYGWVVNKDFSYKVEAENWASYLLITGSRCTRVRKVGFTGRHLSYTPANKECVINTVVSSPANSLGDED